MKRLLLFLLSIMAMPSAGVAATATVTKNVIGCESIGTWMMADKYYEEGDDVAAKRVIKMAFARGDCTIIKKGTKVFFYHFMTIDDGDYGDRTTVRAAGGTSPWVIDKCSLDGRDTELAKFPAYTLPEKPCDQKGQP